MLAQVQLLASEAEHACLINSLVGLVLRIQCLLVLQFPEHFFQVLQIDPQHFPSKFNRFLKEVDTFVQCS